MCINVPCKRQCRQGWRPANFNVDKIWRITWHSQSPSGAVVLLARGVPHTGARVSLLHPFKHRLNNLCHSVCTAKLVGSRDKKTFHHTDRVRSNLLVFAPPSLPKQTCLFISSSAKTQIKHPGLEQQDGRGLVACP